MLENSMTAAHAHDQNNFLQLAISLSERLEPHLQGDVLGSQIMAKLRGVLDSLVWMNRSIMPKHGVSWEDLVDPDNVLRETVALAEFSEVHSCKIEQHLGSRGAVIAIPEVHLKQVVYNLLKNAMEAAPEEGGSVVVESTIQAMEGWGSSVQGMLALCITITDNGPGISEEIRGRLFEQGASSKATGNGLGLYYARKIVERYGGSITLRDAPHLGTLATVIWPVERSSTFGFHAVNRNQS